MCRCDASFCGPRQRRWATFARPSRIALCCPSLHLTLRHNGKSVYAMSGGSGTLSGERLRERIGLFFGREVRDGLYAVEAAQGVCTLRGFIADPACERGNARTQYLFVNGRWIRDRTLGHALQEAYRGLLMTGRYAVAFLFLELPPDLVDVNVHPTKAEVRFQNSQLLHHLVFSAVRDRLRAENLTARLQVPSTLPAPQPRGGDVSGTDPAALPFAAPVRDPEREAPLLDLGTRPQPPAAPLPPPAPDVPQPPWPRAADLPREDTAKVIQLYDAYLVVETPEGMLVIDQHALHERILFEQFKRLLRDGPLESQRLLLPEPIELSAEQAALHAGAAAGPAGIGTRRRGLRRRHRVANRLSRPVAAAVASVSAARRGRSPDDEGETAGARSAAQQPAQSDGLSCGGAGRRPPDAGGNDGPGGSAQPGGRHAPLPTRPAHGPAVQPSGTRPPVSPRVMRLALVRHRRCPT